MVVGRVLLLLLYMHVREEEESYSREIIIDIGNVAEKFGFE